MEHPLFTCALAGLVSASARMAIAAANSAVLVLFMVFLRVWAYRLAVAHEVDATEIGARIPWSANEGYLYSLWPLRSEEHTSELQSLRHLVCRLLLETLPVRSEEHTSELQSLRHLVCRLLLHRK